MQFRIADTFTTSLARLTGEEQKAAKTTAFDLQVDPTSNGMSFHKLDRAKDPNFWSVRVSRDIRLIVHKTAGSLLLCYVDHHDKAYQWAERRKLEVHPTTGAAQLVEVRERVEEILVPKYVEDSRPATGQKPKLFAKYGDAQLLAYGVPQEWLADVKAADEDSLLELANHLPGEAAEALLELATGGTPALPEVAAKGTDPFQHPDAQRRFRVMSDTDELARALEYPWDKWTVFLHPAQRQLVERHYNGAARVSGSAGTGKTVVALHRAVHLAHQDEDARVLLSTFSDTLANALRGNLYRLIWNTPKLGERIDVAAMDALGIRLCAAEFGKPVFASRDEISMLLKAAATQVDGLKANAAFVLSEWEDVVDTWQVESWEAYRDAKRLGRKTRLPEAQRALYWQVFAKVKEQLKQAGKITAAEMFAKLAEAMPKRKHPVFDYIVVDEAQDIGVFVRSDSERPRAQAAVKAAGLQGRVLGKDMATEEGFVSITTMHLAKGMEFRVVAVMACDDEIIPSQVRIDTAADEAELTEIYNTERQLLYVACTRARDQLHVSAVKPESEFLGDLLQK